MHSQDRLHSILFAVAVFVSNFVSFLILFISVRVFFSTNFWSMMIIIFIGHIFLGSINQILSPWLDLSR